MSPEDTEGRAAVETVEVTMKVPKELKEIIDAETMLIKHFVNGGDLAGATAMLPAILAAVDGWQKVGEEVKSQYQDEAAGYLVWKQWDSLKTSGQ